MAQDILLDNTYNPAIRHGDFDVYNSDEQHMQMVLISEPGWWKEHPLMGVGIHREIKGPFSPQQRQALSQRIRLHMQMDGFAVRRANVGPNAELDIECTR
jgi:hypothetical protein